jgi:tetratricopeptide (TPR) repeat protein
MSKKKNSSKKQNNKKQLSNQSKQTVKPPKGDPKKDQSKAKVKKEWSYAKPISVETSRDPLLRKIFYGSAFLMLFFMIFMAVGAGINEDEKFQNVYAKDLYNYYSTFGSDTTVLYHGDNSERGRMRFYGGFFDLTAYTASAIFGVDDDKVVAYHSIRHILIAILGFIALLFTGLFARHIGGWPVGLIALYLLFLSPRFLGHSLINPKDIPFAAGTIMALYYTAKFLANMERPGWKVLVGLGVGIGIAIGTRVGGLLLIAYLAMFIGLEMWRRYGLVNSFANVKRLLNIAKWALAGLLVAFVVTIIFWPFALENPIKHPFEALSEMTNVVINIKLLFQGHFVWGKSLPWNYPLVWIFNTIPIFIFVGFALFLVFIRRIIKHYTISPLHLVAFAMVFPIAYIIYKNSTLHDGWRHLNFTYPPMVIIASVGWYTLIKWTAEKQSKAVMYVAIAALGLTALEPAIFIARNHHYPYVYFNPIAGGVSGAFGKFELDYWGTSIKQGVEWLDKEGVFDQATEEEPVVLATNSYYVATAYTAHYGKKVKLVYTRYYSRDQLDWDYAIFTSRFLNPKQMQIGNWPLDSKVIHNIKANNTPLLAIMKEENKYAMQGWQLSKQKKLQEAINFYLQEKEAHPTNEVAYLRLASLYLNAGNLPKAKEMADKALEISPEWDQGYYVKGVVLYNDGKRNNQPQLVEEAKQLYVKAIKVNKLFSAANQQLAVIAVDEGRFQDAVYYLEEFLQNSKPSKQIYSFAAQIYEKAGYKAKADQFKAAAAQMK